MRKSTQLFNIQCGVQVEGELETPQRYIAWGWGNNFLRPNQNGGILFMTPSFVQWWWYGQKMCFEAKFTLGPSTIL